MSTATSTVRVDSLRIGDVFAFAGRTWQHMGRSKHAAGLSNVLDAHGAKTMLPAASMVRPVAGDKPRTSKAPRQAHKVAKAPKAAPKGKPNKPGKEAS